MKTPIAAVSRPASEEHDRERQRRGESDPRADPGAEGEQRDLAEGDHPDPPVEHAEAGATTE